MSSDNIINVSELTDDQLQEQLKLNNITIGPITSTTRFIYERELRKRLTHSCMIENEENFTESPLAKDYNKPEPVLQSKSNETECCDIYYGIFISEAPKCQEMGNLVCTDKAICISTMKKYPGARFKGFASYKDALEFSCNGPTGIKLSYTNSTADVEKSNLFRGPKSQDLMKFRKAIEKGQMDYVEECVNANPRYLISAGDSPAILQEGPRYNAVLVACRTDQTEICAKILETVSSPAFFQRLYPEEDVVMPIKGSKHLLDLYLNTPDKGHNDTPLHFACKYGSLGCVKILLSYIDCDRDKRNKNGETAFQIICTRTKGNSGSLKSDIEALFEEQFYVPVFRDEDNCVEASVGSPFSPRSDQSILSPNSSFSSRMSPQMKIRGFAGPMSPQQAEKFYSRWRYSPAPSGSPKGKIACIRIEDHEKGLERVGRNIALDFKVKWREYWGFLNDFVDLSTQEGLNKLEDYLKQKYQQLFQVIEDRNMKVSQESLYTAESQLYELDINEVSDTNEDTTDISIRSTSTTGDMCNALEALRLNVSLSPVAFEDFKSRSLLDSPDYSRTLNDKYLPLIKSPEDCSEILDDSVGIFYNYIFRSAQITADKLVDFIKEFSLENEDQSMIDGSVYRTLLHFEIIPEILSFRTLIRKAIADIKIDKKALDLGILHVALVTLMLEKIAEDIPFDAVCNLYRIFRNESKEFCFDYFIMEEEEVLCEFTYAEKEDAFKHIKCILSNVERGLNIIKKPLNCDGNQKISFDLLNNCNCSWSVTFKKLETPYRFNKSISELPQKIHSNSAVKRITSLIRKFLFGSSEDQPAVKSENEKNVVKHLTFEDEIDEAIDTESNYSFETAASSIGDYGGMMTPDEMIKVYIGGMCPSKEDVDILNAIEDIIISEDCYPHIFRWKLLVESASQEIRNSWASPCCRSRALPRSAESLRSLSWVDDSPSSYNLRKTLFQKWTQSPS